MYLNFLYAKLSGCKYMRNRLVSQIIFFWLIIPRKSVVTFLSQTSNTFLLSIAEVKRNINLFLDDHF